MIGRKWSLFVGISGLIVCLDQVTKYLIYSNMPLHSSIPIIDGFFSITYITNPGAAFGFLSTAPAPFRTVFFIAVIIAAILLIIYSLHKYDEGGRPFTLSLSFIMGGAVGNLIDRIRFGEVVDFLDFYIGPHHWPAFNVADSAISVGAFLLFVEMIRKAREKDNVA